MENYVVTVEVFVDADGREEAMEIVERQLDKSTLNLFSIADCEEC